MISTSKYLNSLTEKLESSWYRSLILGILVMCGMLGPITSVIYLPAIPNIQKEFDSNSHILDTVVSSFILTYGICPLIWGLCADRYGRRGAYLTSLSIFIVGSLGCAISSDIVWFFVMHMIQGIGSSASLVLGVGTITDIFSNENRGRALSIVYLGPVFGVLLGPVLGGVLTQYVNWQVIFWFLMGMGIFLYIAFFFLVPETLKETTPPPIWFDWGNRRFAFGPILNPFEPIGLLRFPVYLIACLSIGLCAGGFSFVLTTIPRSLTSIYKINASQLGGISVMPGLGSIIGNLISGFISDRNCQSPESRLRFLWLGSLILSGGILLHGWCLHSILPIPVMLLALLLIGLGSFWSILGSYTYIANVRPSIATMAVACGGFARLTMASVIVTFNTSLLDKVGYLFASLIYSGLALLSFLILIILSWQGDKIRFKTGPASSI